MAACKEKHQLMEKYHKAVRAYSDAVKSLVALAGDIPFVEFDYAKKIAAMARRSSREARAQLRTHLSKHGC